MMDAWTGAGVSGILYAEDFGEPPAPDSAPDPAPAPSPRPEDPAPWDDEPPLPEPPPALTRADLDAACIQAVHAAEQAWTEGAAERRTLALEALGGAIAAARAEAAMEAEALAEALARTMLGMVAGALPALCQAHGDAEVRALLRHLLPIVGHAPGVVVRLHAGLLDTVAADLARLDDDLAGTIELRAANLPPGDVRVAWAGGGLVRDTAAIHSAMRDCLATLGLVPPAATGVTTETRSLAHAHEH